MTSEKSSELPKMMIQLNKSKRVQISSHWTKKMQIKEIKWPKSVNTLLEIR